MDYTEKDTKEMYDILLYFKYCTVWLQISTLKVK